MNLTNLSPPAQQLYILLALAVAVASAQVSQPAGSEAAPEPYSYGYETDSHSAAEQRDPSGKVTGFYTLVDADGRQRRVEYIADEAGFRAKVQTNEVGTKSENSADVEVLAAPPTEAQLAPVQVQASAAPVVQSVSRAVQVTAAPARSSAISYAQQPSGYGYYGYGAYPSYGYSQYGYASQPYGYGYNSYNGYNGNYASAPSGYGYGYTSAPGVNYGYTTGSVGNYNNHLPSQYYKSIQTTTGVTGGPSYVVGGQSGNTVRYVNGVVPTGSYQNQGTYRSYSSSSLPAVSSSGQLLSGSNNYIVLKKRAAEEKKN